jgi:hypothetical protein
MDIFGNLQLDSHYKGFDWAHSQTTKGSVYLYFRKTA